MTAFSKPRAAGEISDRQREDTNGDENKHKVNHGNLLRFTGGKCISGASRNAGGAACLSPRRRCNLQGQNAAALQLAVSAGAATESCIATVMQHFGTPLDGVQVRPRLALPPMTDPTSNRPRPEDFLELVQKGKRGRLKLYIGFAAGVGKTYRMLEEAHALKQRAVDVVIGFVESHGRQETEALVAGLEVVPRRRVGYRGVFVEEMSLNSILKRNPAVAVIDELAHTNLPDSHNKKRYQDVIELLDAGINVIGALNVQHLESLNDVVERSTGVAVRETVPDSFLKQADQVVNLDLAVEDLQERLRAGKIYSADKIPWALNHFFKERNLAHLRELALREVAESVERAATRPALTDPAGPESKAHRSRSRVMVCISSASARAAGLVRKGSRLAGRLSTDWFVVFVETPRERSDQIDAEAQRRLMTNTELAHELGAEVIRLQQRDPVEAILEFARSHSVGHIVVGRSGQPAWRQIFGLSIPSRLVREGYGLDIHVVALENDEGDEAGS
jgi:two-component system sensor histidine kinase KdpD